MSKSQTSTKKSILTIGELLDNGSNNNNNNNNKVNNSIANNKNNSPMKKTPTKSNILVIDHHHNKKYRLSERSVESNSSDDDNENKKEKERDEDEDESVESNEQSKNNKKKSKNTPKNVKNVKNGRKRDSLSKLSKTLTKDDFQLICKNVEDMCVPIRSTEEISTSTWHNFFPAIKQDGTCVYVFKIKPNFGNEKDDDDDCDTESLTNNKNSKKIKSRYGKLQVNIPNSSAKTIYKMVDYNRLRVFLTGRTYKKFPAKNKPADNVYYYDDKKLGKVKFVYWTQYFIDEREKEKMNRQLKKNQKLQEEESNKKAHPIVDIEEEEKEEKEEEEMEINISKKRDKNTTKKLPKISNNKQTEIHNKKRKRETQSDPPELKKSSKVRVIEMGDTKAKGKKISFDSDAEDDYDVEAKSEENTDSQVKKGKKRNVSKKSHKQKQSERDDGKKKGEYEGDIEMKEITTGIKDEMTLYSWVSWFMSQEKYQELLQQVIQENTQVTLFDSNLLKLLIPRKDFERLIEGYKKHGGDFKDTKMLIQFHTFQNTLKIVYKTVSAINAKLP